MEYHEDDELKEYMKLSDVRQKSWDILVMVSLLMLC